MKRYCPILLTLILLGILCLMPATTVSAISGTTTSISTDSITTSSVVVPSQNDILQERLSFASEVIAGQSSFANRLTVLITVVTGLFSIGLPILTYYFSVRPSQKAIAKMDREVTEMRANLEKEVNDRINSYLTASWNKLVDETLQYIQDHPNENVSDNGKAIELTNIFLSLKERVFSDKQLSKIYFLLTDSTTPLENTTEIYIVQILAQTGKNIYAEKYFKYILEISDKPYIMGHGVVVCAVRYYVTTMQQYGPIYKYIKSALPEEEFDEKSFGKRSLSLFIQDCPDIVLRWADDKTAIDELSTLQISYLISCFDRVNKGTILDLLNKLKSSYLFQKYNLGQAEPAAQTVK